MVADEPTGIVPVLLHRAEPSLTYRTILHSQWGERPSRLLWARVGVEDSIFSLRTMPHLTPTSFPSLPGRRDLR
ncbi:hypothetical protein PAPYR_4199 [Paratrimastix pyriformis]|uniref:Uncharacterized protein n=1 Tax=Paratrimastix pyriformis TaxID=342808 RepID=A0ABQ8UMV1_9EUKA|nr:hypothetical protein PAPYR_4199 [Paratrimastix pyriformis]